MLYKKALALAALLSACTEGASSITRVTAKIEAPPLIDIGDVQIGMEGRAEVAIRNIGMSGLGVTQVAVGPAFATSGYAFAVPESPFPLATSQTHTLIVTFRPFEEGNAESWFEVITDGVEDGVPVTAKIAVRGRGVSNGLGVDPIDFGTVLVGTSKTLDVKLTNRLAIDVDLTTTGVTHVSGSGRIQLDFAGARLGPGESVTARATYTPALPEEDQARFEVQNCADALCRVQIQMIGRGTLSALACEPALADFGEINPGVTAARTIRCTNVASGAVVVTGWALTPGSATSFSVEAAPRSRTLEAGGEIAFAVSLTPTDADRATRQLIGAVEITGLSSSLSDLTPIQVQLQALVGSPEIEVTPQHLSFGIVSIGGQRTKSFVITNAGFRTLSVSSIVSASSAFEVNMPGFALAVGTSTVVRVTYRPVVTGNDASEIEIASDDPAQPSTRVAVLGQAVDLGPCSYSVTPNIVLFGVVPLNTSRTEGVRIENTGSNDCLLADLALETTSSAFVLQGGLTDGVVLAPGAAHEVTIEFLPTQSSTERGELVFTISDPAAPRVRIPVSGTGDIIYPDRCFPSAMGLGTPHFPAPGGIPYSNVGDNVNGWTPVPGNMLWTTDGTNLISVGYHDFLPVSANSFVLEADVIIENSISDLQIALWDDNYLLGYKMSLGPAGGDTPYFGLFKVFNDPARNVYGRPYGDDLAIFCRSSGSCNTPGNPVEPEAGDLMNVDTNSGSYPSSGTWFHFRYEKVGGSVSMSVNGLPPVTYSSPCLDQTWRLVIGSWANVQVRNLTIR